MNVAKQTTSLPQCMAHLRSLAYVGVFIILVLSTVLSAQAQDEPVTGTFESGTFMETQTVATPFAKEIELLIHHRFGTVDNGLEDLYGLYAPSNIRLGVNYGVTDKIMVGYGYTKDLKFQEFHGKWRFLEQTQSESIPVTLAIYGNLGLSAMDKQFFGSDYSFSDRLSYFSQLIIARKINDNFSVQVAPSFTHFNKVDSLSMDNKRAVEHDQVAITLSGRARITPSTFFIIEYDQPLYISAIREYNKLHFKTQPNLSFGVEIGTSTHVFQVFMTTYEGITPQKNMLDNPHKWWDEGLRFGFNIQVRF